MKGAESVCMRKCLHALANENGMMNGRQLICGKAAVSNNAWREYVTIVSPIEAPRFPIPALSKYGLLLLTQVVQLKLTNLGSLGLPSGPMPSRLNRSCTTCRLASSKPRPRFFIICLISFLAASSRPARESPLSTLPARLKLLELKPSRTSSAKDSEGVSGSSGS